ncbi:MAG: inner-membrane translocator, branched-chain amino acid transport system permease protein [Candidatus Peregrinibacteria bacterium GW2011_GWF2_33_10]|nr:MAG: inner-membrane translocator, branched-chain amino acid transport system permease protein [Candidatus Peregrinibacteria bacterium GW2011_GWF2_33_10]
MVCIFSILTISLNYIAGYTGIMSFCHAAFYGIGAYSTAILLKNFDLSFISVLFFSLIITAICGFIASIFILRLKDDGQMLVSVAFALIVYNLMLNLVSLTNGTLGIKGIPAIEIFGVNFFEKWKFFLLCLFLLLFTIWFFRKIIKSPYGTVIKGIRDNCEVVENLAHPTSIYKHLVFVLGVTFAGLAGSIFATYITYLEPSLFLLISSIFVLIMAIFGGLGNIWGSVLGAIIIFIIPEILRFVGLPDSIMAETQQIIYGFLLFLLIYFRPQGVMGEYRM